MVLNADRQAFADSAEALLKARCTPSARQAAREAGGFDRGLWREILAQGWCGVHLPEVHGGLGLGLSEAIVLAEALGRHLAPVPWFESAVLAGEVLQAIDAVQRGAGGAMRWVGAVARGEAIAAFPAEATTREVHPAATGPAGAVSTAIGAPVCAVPAGDGGWQLDGTLSPWPAALAADVLLVPAAAPDGEALLLAVPASAAGVQREALHNHDATRPLARIRFVATPLRDDAVLDRGKALHERLRRARRRAAIVLGAEQVGVAQRALDLALEHVTQRVQFDQPVAKFQAVKHRCAQVMVALELARSAVHGAAAAADAGAEGEDLLRQAAMARVLATDAAQSATQECIQLHGGMGYTWDCEAHWLFKRSQSAAVWLGAPSAWAAQALRGWDPLHAGTDPAAGPPGEPDEDRALRAAMTAWMQAHLQGRFAPLRDGAGPGDPGFDADLAKAWEQALADGGWVGIGWPVRHGGRALPLHQQVIVHEVYARCGGLGRLGHIGEHLLAPTLMAFGTAAQQQRFLPGIRAGRTYWAQGYSEPNAGSDLANVQTRARRDGDAWRLDGQKVWTSWAREADWIFVLARTEPGSQRHRGLSMLLVPLRQPGVTIRPIRQITGGAEFNEVFFDDARTEADLCLGEPGQGWAVAMALLGFERGVSTLGQQAHFEHEWRDLVAAAQDTGAWDDPLLRQRIARAALGLQALRCNALRVLDAPQGSLPGREALIAKYAWSNWRRDLGRLAADVLGPRADVIDPADALATRLQHLWLSSRADTIYAGTNEIQLNLIAERGLGLPR